MSNSVYQSFRIIRGNEKHSINKNAYFYRIHSVITQQERRNSSIGLMAILHVFLFISKNYNWNYQVQKDFEEMILNDQKILEAYRVHV